MDFRGQLFPTNPHYQKSLALLVGSCFHLGKYRSFRHDSITSYLLGVRQNIDYFRSLITLAHLKSSLRFYHKCVVGGLISKILFFRHNDVVSTFISKVIRVSIAFLTNRWPVGIIGNWHTKVRVPFINYQLGVPYKLRSSEHNRYFKLLKGFKCLSGKPDLVLFLDFPGSIALKDCWLNGVPCIVVVDSNLDSTYATYVIPANRNGIFQCVVLSLFLELLFIFFYTLSIT